MDPANIVSQERDSNISFPILRTRPKAARMTPEPALTRATPIFSNSAIAGQAGFARMRSEEHTSELQSRLHLVCRLLLEKKKTMLSSHTSCEHDACS